MGEISSRGGADGCGRGQPKVSYEKILIKLSCNFYIVQSLKEDTLYYTTFQYISFLQINTVCMSACVSRFNIAFVNFSVL